MFRQTMLHGPALNARPSNPIFKVVVGGDQGNPAFAKTDASLGTIGGTFTRRIGDHFEFAKDLTDKRLFSYSHNVADPMLCDVGPGMHITGLTPQYETSRQIFQG